jgi:hypothetical protein
MRGVTRSAVFWTTKSRRRASTGIGVIVGITALTVGGRLLAGHNLPGWVSVLLLLGSLAVAMAVSAGIDWLVGLRKWNTVPKRKI